MFVSQYSEPFPGGAGGQMPPPPDSSRPPKHMTSYSTPKFLILGHMSRLNPTFLLSPLSRVHTHTHCLLTYMYMYSPLNPSKGFHLLYRTFMAIDKDTGHYILLFWHAWRGQLPYLMLPLRQTHTIVFILLAYFHVKHFLQISRKLIKYSRGEIVREEFSVEIIFERRWNISNASRQLQVNIFWR